MLEWQCDKSREDLLVEKKLKKYAITETSHFISNFIQQIVDDVSNNKLDDNKIFSISRNNYNEIEIIDFNTKEVNNVLEEITTKIEENLKMLEQGKIKNLNISSTFKGKNFKGIHDGVLFELGDNFFGNKVFNIETKIPLRISFIGNVYTSISTKIKNYGLNSAYLEVIVKVEVKETYSDDMRAGLVVSTSPDRGTYVQPGSTVTITVSKGREQVTIPSVSVGMTYEEAVEALNDAGFKGTVKEATEYSASVGNGFVTRYSPSKTVDPDGTVTIYVSLGTQSTTE